MADAISITMDDKRVRQMLAKLPEQTNRALRLGLEDGGTLLYRDLTDYPAPPPGSTYVRTRTEGRSWSKSPVFGAGPDMSIEVGSSGHIAPYNIYVQNEPTQARIHKGRWPTIQGVRRDREGDIRAMFAARLGEELNR
jgi:hypothetical protein